MQEVIGSTPIFSTKPDHYGQVFLFMAAFVYILYSTKTNKYYVGHTENLEDRLERHNAGRNLTTKAGASWALKLVEEFPTKVEAAKRESEIKEKENPQIY